MSSFNTRQPSAPRHIPTDSVIPLHRQDDTFQNRNLSVEFTMRFDDVLDAQQLADSLWKLLEKPGWRKLGARLRLNKSTDRLEYHIPTQYTKERPPINFTQNSYDMRLEEHHIGRRFPKVDDGDRIQAFDVLDSLHELTQTENSTAVLADWIYSDKAQLGLHIVNFQDATLVTLTWLHALLDGMGRRALLNAWVAVLEGRDDDVPEFWGYDFDPLEDLGAPLKDDARSIENSPASKEKQHRFWMATQGIKTWLLRLLSFKSAFAYLYSRIFGSSQINGGRMIYMPPSYMTRLRTEAMRDLASLDSSQITYNTSSPANPKPFLSDGDIISAWLVQRLAVSDLKLLKSPPSRPVQIINVLGMRDILSTATAKYKVLIPKDKAYIGNCTAGIITQLGLKQFLDLPLGHLAARLRKDLVEQGTRDVVEERQRANRTSQQTSASPPNASMAPARFVISNWAKGKFFETDFSAAIVPGKGPSTNSRVARGKPTYIHAYATDARVNSNEAVLGSIGNCVGKDARGGYWIGGLLAKAYEQAFEVAVLGG
ncbi:uncharacterized protein yc1106_00631 [Curvularia clavata]|uniref:LysR family regulatory protein n=1 Tax=Curvularia clavata TaxID=95742 RepID=A0A9Q9DNG3_CURCL|nr:uncharacterized protein yc1106_00631 [Curvularia clavata]